MSDTSCGSETKILDARKLSVRDTAVSSCERLHVSDTGDRHQCPRVKGGLLYASPVSNFKSFSLLS